MLFAALRLSHFGAHSKIGGLGNPKKATALPDSMAFSFKNYRSKTARGAHTDNRNWFAVGLLVPSLAPPQKWVSKESSCAL